MRMIRLTSALSSLPFGNVYISANTISSDSGPARRGLIIGPCKVMRTYVPAFTCEFIGSKRHGIRIIDHAGKTT